MDGHKHLKSLRIAPEVVDPADVEMLQDLVLAAVNDARAKVEEKLKDSLGGLAGGMPGGFPFGAHVMPAKHAMAEYTPPLARLIDELKKIPGIGRKSAQRIAFFLLRTERKNALALAEAIVQAREKTFYCSRCNNITAVDPCEICSDPERDPEKICVVEEPFNIHSIEKTGLYHGHYHVLMGNLSPIRGIGPDELRIAGLEKRVRDGTIPRSHPGHQPDHRRQRHGPLFDRNSPAV